ncbi:attractin [Limosa lapponica baueri]|uniref:Attractin n=1 Tax=Limosa lapponica baueri TaxID=1758121 RepID=A0A2I0UR19_LIMLA|nr:attractin [Limosa lapponica baueri]
MLCCKLAAERGFGVSRLVWQYMLVDKSRHCSCRNNSVSREKRMKSHGKMSAFQFAMERAGEKASFIHEEEPKCVFRLNVSEISLLPQQEIWLGKLNFKGITRQLGGAPGAEGKRCSWDSLSTVLAVGTTQLFGFDHLIWDNVGIGTCYRRLTGPSGYVTDGPGNYKYKTKCTWLIEGRPNTILRLRFNHFATECSWDHLYVYDGDSIYAPLLAAFSGLIVPEKDSNETVPEVVATSGYALLHFFSDAAYNLTGFNITYNFNMCPNNCSGRGECKLNNSSNALECECAKYWKGEACDIPYCTDDCGAPERGHCNFNDTKACLCSAGWQGPGCSIPVPANRSFWTREEYSLPKLPRASHKTVIHDNKMWIVGGYVFNHSDSQKVLAYDLISEEWLPLNNTVNSVEMRYGHSLALHKDDIYMYGGKIDATGNVTSQLWLFRIPTQTWTQVTPQAKEQYAVVGHSAHIVTLKDNSTVMLVIFGHCPLYGYISNVQEYNLDTNTWNILQTSGALVQGGYGHSSVYDSSTRSIYIHGGYKAFSANKYRLADDLYKYEVDSRMWTILKDSKFFRYLHTAVIVSGTMLVFGGNTHNDTSMSHGAKCFSSDFMAYDIACDRWAVLPRPGLHHDVNRFGHSAVLYNSTMYVFGGFNSLLLSDILKYTPERCEAFDNETACLQAGPGVRCVWVSVPPHCVPWEMATVAQRQKVFEDCPPKPENICGTNWHLVGNSCLKITNAKENYDHAKLSCRSNGALLASLTTQKKVEFVTKELQKMQSSSKTLTPWVGLRKINVSYWCWEDMSPFTNNLLKWLPDEPSDAGFCGYLAEPFQQGLKAATCINEVNGSICERPANHSAKQCRTPCALRTMCGECTSGSSECMWCSNMKQCVDSNAYVASFPYGQCMEWYTMSSCPPENCSGYCTCAHCLEQPGCGWCTDPSNTGKGKCIEGSYRGPVKMPTPSTTGKHSLEPVLNVSMCPAENNYNWSFIQCPACQCNGHSKCVNESICEKCENLTTGKHCEICISGYYGDPTNGGTCQHTLLIDYQFTFSLSQEDDRYYTAINFVATPEEQNRDLDMFINASKNFNLNITWSTSFAAGTQAGEEIPVVSRTNIKEYKDSFSNEKFDFRNNPNITFFVYVSNFTWPIKIQVSMLKEIKTRIAKNPSLE